jgi:hypothetical protein
VLRDLIEICGVPSNAGRPALRLQADAEILFFTASEKYSED